MNLHIMTADCCVCSDWKGHICRGVNIVCFYQKYPYADIATFSTLMSLYSLRVAVGFYNLQSLLGGFDMRARFST
jgi:hypothetical protein